MAVAASEGVLSGSVTWHNLTQLLSDLTGQIFSARVSAVTWLSRGRRRR
jgi:hypothetical protein